MLSRVVMADDTRRDSSSNTFSIRWYSVSGSTPASAPATTTAEMSSKVSSSVRWAGSPNSEISLSDSVLKIHTSGLNITMQPCSGRTSRRASFSGASMASRLGSRSANSTNRLVTARNDRVVDRGSSQGPS